MFLGFSFPAADLFGEILGRSQPSSQRYAAFSSMREEGAEFSSFGFESASRRRSVSFIYLREARGFWNKGIS